MKNFGGSIGGCKGNKLSLNVAKTRSMLITTKKKKKYLTDSHQALQASIREEHIEVICHSKYLQYSPKVLGHFVYF